VFEVFIDVVCGHACVMGRGRGIGRGDLNPLANRESFELVLKLELYNITLSCP
jgi:hypothetical protein